MNTTPIVRTAYFQWLMNETKDEIGPEAVRGGFDGAWERLIAAKLLTETFQKNLLAFQVLAMTGDSNFTAETYLKAAKLITSSISPSENKVDIGID